MKFTEIANRLTGISTPFGGASWQPAELEIAGARRVIAFLEDRRVLYDPCQMEVPDLCLAKTPSGHGSARLRGLIPCRFQSWETSRGDFFEAKERF